MSETPPDISQSPEAIQAEPAPALSIATEASAAYINAAEAAPTTVDAAIQAAAVDRREDTSTKVEDQAPIDPAAIAGEQFKRLFSAALAYPVAARRTGKTGTVGLAVTIDAAGTVLAAGVTSSSGSALLDAAAIQAAKAVPTVPAPGRPLRLAIRAVFSAGAASLES